MESPEQAKDLEPSLELSEHDAAAITSPKLYAGHELNLRVRTVGVFIPSPMLF